MSDSPKPAHIDEIARSIRDEGWVSHSYLYGRGEAIRGTDNPQRMKELCDGFPAYSQGPYPCPKPVGELTTHLPIDQQGLKLSQRLFIEKGKDERVQSLSITSESGKCCRVASPWPGGTYVFSEAGEKITIRTEPMSVVSFRAEPGQTYYLREDLPDTGGNCD